ncbi:uncharacterized protein [Garra rufa]|uniref:uncharacterized protein n=1 Tax=Garra rufa TaxID=137080 RepID=UPI003CCEC416
MSQMWMLRWVVLLAGLESIQAVRSNNHVKNICSLWGNFHFKTFDGDFYQFPGTCEYNLVSECQSPIRQFSVHVKRTENSSSPKISRVSITINDVTIKITKNQVMVNGENKTLPVHVAGILVEENTIYIRLYSKLGIAVMWNKEDAVMVKLDSRYSNRTCGLCGDFNGVPVNNEFIESKLEVGIIEFGNKYRVLNPEHGCNDPSEEILVDQCTKHQADCEDLLKNEDWFSCITILNPKPYIEACMKDMCLYHPEDTDNSTLCATLSAYSRQCSHAGGIPPTWRRANFCAVTCPYNMVHSESGSPCMDTCSHKDTNTLCEEHNIDGCFCPPGTVFDEISNTGCIPVEKCQCKHDRIYNPGEVLYKKDEKCTCKKGNWICESIPVPGLCAVEEGSHFTTFDGKEFTFHGDCNYVLSKDCKKSKFIILGQIVPCVSLNTDTCLKSILVLFNNDKNQDLLIKADGTVVQHNAQVSLPYITATFTVFMPSSFYIMLQTTFGLQVQVQLVPLMQVYITVDQHFQGKTCGLCGNFNKVLSDDLMTPQRMVEGTAISFANAWKAQSNCPDRTERMDDPCSYSSDSEHFAEYWCSKMKHKESLFAQCHSTVNPESYYKRCKYSSCTCEKSEDCLCAVFSSYARACAVKGIFLQGWRKIVCEKYTKNCPDSHLYSYQLQNCQRTCLSLASKRQSCRVDFVPIDGCACPDGLYQDEKGLCIPMEKCPCYNNGVTVQPGKSINIKKEHCVCVNGTFHCLSLKTSILECPPLKVFFNCSTARPDEHGLLCAQTCMQEEVDCVSADCESGCQCPAGLLDDGRGNCVKPYDCPCPHNGQFYAPGTEITVDCNNCTCQQGNWTCTEHICPGVCTIYGSGHYKTFDQQRFGFRGECSYTAAQDKCGNKMGVFHVITENIPCGTTGTTCSKAVIILLGRTKLELSDKIVKATDIGSGPQIKYNERNIGMYLVIDAEIGLTVLWDRKTTVHIILQPQHMKGVCGLCGNFNGNGIDDFTTQGSLQTTDIMEFVDSWKVFGTCPDADPDFDPCFETPNRVTWAQRECSIIKDVTFKDCHNKVDPNPYYENCVRDSCACDTGGDCECFCTAVAAYAQACNRSGVCVDWRTPNICPVYCDYYNTPEECTWHYSPCHTPCYKTCRNSDDICNNTLPHLEGCYPKCPIDKPIFDEQSQKCVKDCCVGCYVNGTQYKPGEKIPTDKSCHECICNELCNTQCFQKPECCYYGGKEYADKDIIYKPDHMGINTIYTYINYWHNTYFNSYNHLSYYYSYAIYVNRNTIYTYINYWHNTYFNRGDDDNETYENIKKSGKTICEKPRKIECRNVGLLLCQYNTYSNLYGNNFSNTYFDFNNHLNYIYSYAIYVNRNTLYTYINYWHNTYFNSYNHLNYYYSYAIYVNRNTIYTYINYWHNTYFNSYNHLNYYYSYAIYVNRNTIYTYINYWHNTYFNSYNHLNYYYSYAIYVNRNTIYTYINYWHNTYFNSYNHLNYYYSYAIYVNRNTIYTYINYWHNTYFNRGDDDNETYENIKKTGKTICEKPRKIECRNVGLLLCQHNTYSNLYGNNFSNTYFDFNNHLNYIYSYAIYVNRNTLYTYINYWHNTYFNSYNHLNYYYSYTIYVNRNTIYTYINYWHNTYFNSYNHLNYYYSYAIYVNRNTIYTYINYWHNTYFNRGDDDNETYENIKKTGKTICEKPRKIECRNVVMKNIPFDAFIEASKQVVQCNVSSGLMCKKKEQTEPPLKCFDYEIRVFCCVNTTPMPTSTVTISATPTSTLTTTSTTSTPTPSMSTEIPSTPKSTTGTTPTSTVTTTSTTTTTPTPSTSTEIPSTTSTTTGTTPTSTVTTTSTISTTPTPSTEIPSTTSTTTGTTPTSTVTTTSTITTTTPTPSTSTEIPSTPTSTTGTTPTSTVTTTSTTTTTPTPSTSTEILSTPTSTTGTAPTSTFTTTSTTTTTPTPSTSTEIPSTTTGTTPTSTVTTTSTTTITPTPSTSTEIPSTTSTTTGTTPTSTVTTTSTTTTTPTPSTYNHFNYYHYSYTIYVNRNTIYTYINYWHSTYFNIYYHLNYYHYSYTIYVNRNTIYTYINYWHSTYFNIYYHLNYYHYSYTIYINRNTIYNYYNHLNYYHYYSYTIYVNRNTIYTYINYWHSTYFNIYYHLNYYHYSYTIYINRNTIYNYWHNTYFNSYNHLNYYHYSYTIYINRNTIYNYNTYFDFNNPLNYIYSYAIYVNRNTIYTYINNWHNTNFNSYDHLNYYHYYSYAIYLNRNTINTYINYWHNTYFSSYIHLNYYHYYSYTIYINRNTIYTYINYWHNTYFNSYNHLNYYHYSYAIYVNRNTIYTYINYWHNTYFNSYNHFNYYHYSYTIYVNRNTIYTYINYWHSTYFNIYYHLNYYHYSYTIYVNRNTIYTYINYWHSTYFNIYYHLNYYHYSYTIYINRNTIYNYYNHLNYYHYYSYTIYVNRNTIYTYIIYWHNTYFNSYNHLNYYHCYSYAIYVNRNNIYTCINYWHNTYFNSYNHLNYYHYSYAIYVNRNTIYTYINYWHNTYFNKIPSTPTSTTGTTPTSTVTTTSTTTTTPTPSTLTEIPSTPTSTTGTTPTSTVTTISTTTTTPTPSTSTEILSTPTSTTGTAPTSTFTTTSTITTTPTPSTSTEILSTPTSTTGTARTSTFTTTSTTTTTPTPSTSTEIPSTTSTTTGTTPTSTVTTTSTISTTPTPSTSTEIPSTTSTTTGTTPTSTVTTTSTITTTTPTPSTSTEIPSTPASTTGTTPTSTVTTTSTTTTTPTPSTSTEILSTPTSTTGTAPTSTFTTTSTTTTTPTPSTSTEIPSTTSTTTGTTPTSTVTTTSTITTTPTPSTSTEIPSTTSTTAGTTPTSTVTTTSTITTTTPTPSTSTEIPSTPTSTTGTTPTSTVTTTSTITTATPTPSTLTEKPSTPTSTTGTTPTSTVTTTSTTTTTPTPSTSTEILSTPTSTTGTAPTSTFTSTSTTTTTPTPSTSTEIPSTPTSTTGKTPTSTVTTTSTTNSTPTPSTSTEIPSTTNS